MPDLTSLAKLPLEWLRVACELAPEKPRVPVTDPWVLAVTEHRSTTKRYSGCADLGHWWLTRLGFRRSWLNRAELPGGWVSQVNVGRICATPLGARHEATNILSTVAPPEPGDVLVVGADDPNKTHVCIPLSAWGAKVWFAEYGQPGGAVHEKDVVAEGNRWKLGSRILHSCLHVSALGDPDVGQDFASWAASRELEVPLPMLDNPDKAGETP